MLFKELLSTPYLSHKIGSIADSETVHYQVWDVPVNIKGRGSDHLLTYLFFHPQEYCGSKNLPSQCSAFQHIYQCWFACQNLSMNTRFGLVSGQKNFGSSTAHSRKSYTALMKAERSLE